RRVEIAEYADQGLHPPGLEGPAEGRPARERAPDVPLALHDGMRHHEDRSLRAHLLQVPPSELRVHDDPTGSPGDVRRPWDAERLAPHCVGRTPPLAVPPGFSGGLTSNPIALGDHPLHEVVEGEVVDHDEAGDPDGVTVDVAVEL